MAMNFPDSPTVGQVYTVGSRSWTWDGTTWNGKASTTAYTADKALISDGSGNATTSVTSATELSYLSGVTSSVQTQINAKPSTADLATKMPLYATVLGGSVNLNSLTTPGTYDQASNAQAATGSNYPVAEAGMLTVTSPPNGGMIYQTYQAFGSGNNRVYWRGRYAGTWSTWQQVQIAPRVIDTTSNWWTGYTDAGMTIRSTGGAITVYIQNTLNVGDRIDFIQYGSGQITFVASGVTLNSSGGKLKTTGQYSGATVQCVAAGVYVLIGDIAA